MLLFVIIYPDKVFVTILPSFEAEIADAIFLFNWRKIYLFMKYRHLSDKITKYI